MLYIKDKTTPLDDYAGYRLADSAEDIDLIIKGILSAYPEDEARIASGVTYTLAEAQTATIDTVCRLVLLLSERVIELDDVYVYYMPEKGVVATWLSNALSN